MLQNSYIYQFGSFFDLSDYCFLILNYSRVGSCNSSQLDGVSSENCLILNFAIYFLHILSLLSSNFPDRKLQELPL